MFGGWRSSFCLPRTLFLLLFISVLKFSSLRYFLKATFQKKHLINPFSCLCAPGECCCVCEIIFMSFFYSSKLFTDMCVCSTELPSYGRQGLDLVHILNC